MCIICLPGDWCVCVLSVCLVIGMYVCYLSAWRSVCVLSVCLVISMYVLSVCLVIGMYMCYLSACGDWYEHALGLSDVPGESMVKLYCPKCCDVYTPKSSRHHHIDGVYFGTGFPHMLFMVHPELRPPKPTNQFVPR